jgi:hypothetical protein
MATMIGETFEILPKFDHATVTRTFVNTDFVKLSWYVIGLTYCVSEQKFNMTKLIKKINKKQSYDNWKNSNDGSRFQIKFPEYITQKENCGEKLNGWYISTKLIGNVIPWLNQLLWFEILNGITDHSESLIPDEGYLYLVQPTNYLGTNVFKVGKAWNPKQRFVSYGMKVKIFETVKVKDVDAGEKKLLDAIRKRPEDFKIKEGKEYFECKFEDIHEIFIKIVYEISDDEIRA